MLHLTPEASLHLLRLRKQRGLDDRHGVRFIAKGAKLSVGFAREPQPGDRVFDQQDVPVSVPSALAEGLAGSTIDSRVEDGHSVLVLRHHRN